MAPCSAYTTLHFPWQAVFFGLLNDLFPSIDPERLVNDSLNACVREVCEDMNLWPDDAFVLKASIISSLNSKRNQLTLVNEIREPIIRDHFTAHILSAIVCFTWCYIIQIGRCFPPRYRNWTSFWLFDTATSLWAKPVRVKVAAGRCSRKPGAAWIRATRLRCATHALAHLPVFSTLLRCYSIQLLVARV